MATPPLVRLAPAGGGGPLGRGLRSVGLYLFLKQPRGEIQYNENVSRIFNFVKKDGKKITTHHF